MILHHSKLPNLGGTNCAAEGDTRYNRPGEISQCSSSNIFLRPSSGYRTGTTLSARYRVISGDIVLYFVEKPEPVEAVLVCVPASQAS